MKTTLILLLLFFFLLIASCTVSRPTVTQLNHEPAIFMVAHPLKYSMGRDDSEIEVPVGFITDLASIPKALWWWEAPHEGTLAPAILHDYLYWVQSCTKDEADAVMYLAMREVGMNGIAIRGVYAGIRTPLAENAWRRNTQAKQEGESRFFSKKYALEILNSSISAGETLKSIQSRAVARGGMVKRYAPGRKVKRACELALKQFNSL